MSYFKNLHHFSLRLNSLPHGSREYLSAGTPNRQILKLLFTFPKDYVPFSSIPFHRVHPSEDPLTWSSAHAAKLNNCGKYYWLCFCLLLRFKTRQKCCLGREHRIATEVRKTGKYTRQKESNHAYSVIDFPTSGWMLPMPLRRKGEFGTCSTVQKLWKYTLYDCTGPSCGATNFCNNFYFAFQIFVSCNVRISLLSYVKYR